MCRAMDSGRLGGKRLALPLGSRDEPVWFWETDVLPSAPSFTGSDRAKVHGCSSNPRLTPSYTTLYPCNNTTAYPKSDLPVTTRQLLRRAQAAGTITAFKSSRHQLAGQPGPWPSPSSGASLPKTEHCWPENLKPNKTRTRPRQGSLPLLNSFPCKMSSSFWNHWLELFIHSFVCLCRHKARDFKGLSVYTGEDRLPLICWVGQKVCMLYWCCL